MNDIKAVIAENITQPEVPRYDQAGLAEKLNYTDKAVSKWERRESLPDITVLKAIADCFGVTVDYLITADHKSQPAETAQTNDSAQNISRRNRGFITGMSILLVWLIGCIAFVIINALDGSSCVHWLALVYAIPLSVVVWLVLNSIWFSVHRNFLIISFLMWEVCLLFTSPYSLPEQTLLSYSSSDCRDRPSFSCVPNKEVWRMMLL